MFQFPRFPPGPYTFRAGSQGSPLGDCSIRAPPARRVGAAPRGVSPRPRALHRPRRPRHPPRAHPCDALSPATTTRQSCGARVGPHRVAATLAPSCHPHLPSDDTKSIQHAPLSRYKYGGPPTEVQRGGAARTVARRAPASPARVPLRPPPPPGERGGLVGLLDPGRRAVRTPGDSTWDDAGHPRAPARSP